MSIERVREALRLGTRRADWFPIYEDALTEAYRARDVLEAADIALLGAMRLAGENALDDAVAQLEFGASLVSDRPAAVAHLLCVQSGLLTLTGDIAGAGRMLAEAAASRARAAEPDLAGEAEQRIYESMLACCALSTRPIEELEAAIAASIAQGLDGVAWGLQSWTVPWLAATGQRRHAVPRAESLATWARANDHAWRRADAAAFATALRSTMSMASLPAALPAAAGNRAAQWIDGLVRLRRLVLQADWAAAAAQLEVIREISGRLPPGYADGADCYPALLAAYRDDQPIAGLMPPARLTLLNLGAALAGIEAVAIAGTQDEAVHWHRWMAEHLPPHLRSAIEWPVAVDRVRALLSARVGDVRRAARECRRAIRWADASHYVIEAALGRVQLAEVLALGSQDSPEREWRAMRREGRRALEAVGIDGVPHAYAAARGLALGRHTEHTRRLTLREVEVLRLLADGLSYRAIAERLGIEWRTAQTHARNIYAKLGASGKMHAVTLARDEGIL